ncbi:MAG TPA: hypothetical protein VM029_20370 [Opitutaceae bacterium]|nr:hypothetical protein [Opitutaceae bacterium]
MKRTICMLTAMFLAAFALDASAQAERAVKIAAHYTTLAGSEDNALALVEALRTGTSVKLTQGESAAEKRIPAMIVLDPPTGEMDWKDIERALAMAQAALARARITRPNAEQLEAALLGGDVTNPQGETLAMAGILTLHASGVPWTQVARLATPRPR